MGGERQERINTGEAVKVGNEKGGRGSMFGVQGSSLVRAGDAEDGLCYYLYVKPRGVVLDIPNFSVCISGKLQYAFSFQSPLIRVFARILTSSNKDQFLMYSISHSIRFSILSIVSVRPRYPFTWASPVIPGLTL